jgi:hypothetical protein
MIDRAVSKLCYIYGKRISMMADEIYITDLAKPSEEMVRGEFRLLRDIGMDSVQDARFSKLKNLDPSKQELISKALGLYRIALSSDNPFKAIDSYFSCIHALLKDKFNPISPDSDLKKGLRFVLSRRIKNFDEQEFYDKFGRWYGIWRSNSTHGDLDVSDHKFEDQAHKDLIEVKIWTGELLDEFLTKNQKQ